MIMVFVLACALAALFAIGLWPRWDALTTAQAESAREDIPAVIFVPAKRGAGKAELVLPANLLAFQEATLYARTNGYLKRWTVDIGDYVKTGQLLAEIETPELDRELEQAHAARSQIRAHLELARVTAERYAALVKDEAVSPQEADEKKGQHAVRQADLAAADANVRRLEQLKSFQRVTAPFPGTITARNVDVGSLIQAGSTSPSGWLYKLSQTDIIRVHVSVPQSSMRMIKPGMNVDVLVPELGDRTFGAKVVRSAGAFDAATRTMVVEMHIPNGHGPLLPGMYGQARLHLQNDKPNMQVPINAIMLGGGGARVAVVDKDEVIRIRPVKIGRDFGKEVEILDGLAEQERVVSNPRDSLVEGIKVRAVEFRPHGDKKDAPRSAAPADAKPAPAVDAKPKS
jgi:RND family efflux transporter MFP subunit